MILTPFLPGNGKLTKTDAFIVCGYPMMCIYGKTVFFQKTGDAMQEKTVLENSSRENDRKMVRVQCSTLVQRHTGKCGHKAKGNCAPVCLPAQVFDDAGNYGTGIKYPQGILLIKCQRIRQIRK